jgi:hypothetical protein
MPKDFIVVECVLKPGQSLSVLLIYLTVWKNWRKLAESGIEELAQVSRIRYRDIKWLALRA